MKFGLCKETPGVAPGIFRWVGDSTENRAINAKVLRTNHVSLSDGV